MPDVEDEVPNAQREQTDESLRAEREKADDALTGRPLAVDEIADAVIERARQRADVVLAAARQRSDRQGATRALGDEARKHLDEDRVQADRALQKERAAADETLRLERADVAALLETEREATDKDLALERGQADDALATRDEFLGIVSHDLRNMLGTIVGFAGLIEREGGKQEPNRSVLSGYAQRIHRAGGRMSRLIGDLVDVASIQAGTLAVTCALGDPNAIASEAVEALQAQALAGGITLTLRPAEPPPRVDFDPARVLQLLINLLSNALKFTSRGGSVEVRVEQVANEVHLSVRDTGKGIAQEDLRAIFDRYLQVTPDSRGVGLGLYISQCIANGHGGRIWAESAVGVGSTFYFALPMPAAEPAAAAPGNG